MMMATSVALAFASGNTLFAGIIPEGTTIKARAGYSIGGTAPIGMPASIRSIEAFRLTPSFMLGADATMPLKGKWSISAGLRFENKGMNADVTTKSYSMELKKGDTQILGLFTGHVHQKVSQWMLTLPVQANYALSGKVSLKAGPYFSLLLSKKFDGLATNGYIRQGTPTGPKIDVGNKPGEWATYDFSEDLRKFQWGLDAGVDWQLNPHVGLSADLAWGLSGILKSSFKTVKQTLYPIYGTIGVFYKF